MLYVGTVLSVSELSLHAVYSTVCTCFDLYSDRNGCIALLPALIAPLFLHVFALTLTLTLKELRHYVPERSRLIGKHHLFQNHHQVRYVLVHTACTVSSNKTAFYWQHHML
jgi:hypothetical protein